MNPIALISLARLLASGPLDRQSGIPGQTELRRAFSTSYYALFHTLACCCADMLAGNTEANRQQSAWQRTYRALDHGLARNQCGIQSVMSSFPAEVQLFGKMFVKAQYLRLDADYNPAETFGASDVVQLIDETEQAIAAFNSADREQRRAFAIHVLFRQRTQQPRS